MSDTLSIARNAITWLPRKEMKMTKTIVTTIHDITRGATSTRGVSSYVLHTAHGSFRTQSNSSVGYSLTTGPCRVRVELMMSDAGYVWSVRELTGSLIEPWENNLFDYLDDMPTEELVNMSYDIQNGLNYWSSEWESIMRNHRREVDAILRTRNNVKDFI